jgi:hypothetical protein
MSADAATTEHVPVRWDGCDPRPLSLTNDLWPTA